MPKTLHKFWKRVEMALIVVLLMPLALGAWLLMCWPGRDAFR